LKVVRVVSRVSKRPENWKGDLPGGVCRTEIRGKERAVAIAAQPDRQRSPGRCADGPCRAPGKSAKRELRPILCSIVHAVKYRTILLCLLLRLCKRAYLLSPDR